MRQITKFTAMPRVLIFSIITLWIAGCSNPDPVNETMGEVKPDFESIEKEISQLIDNHNVIFAMGDLDSLMKFYEPDFLRIPPNQELTRGFEAIKIILEDFYKDNAYVLVEGGEKEFQITNELVVAYSTFIDYWVSDANGVTNQREGRLITVWRKQGDDTWKITTEIWNHK